MWPLRLVDVLASMTFWLADFFSECRTLADVRERPVVVGRCVK